MTDKGTLAEGSTFSQLIDDIYDAVSNRINCTKDFYDSVNLTEEDLFILARTDSLVSASDLNQSEKSCMKVLWLQQHLGLIQKKFKT